MYGRGCGPTKLFAVLPRMRQASLGPLLQNLAFERRENGQQPSHGTSGWRGQVQGLGQGHEAHSEMLQFLEGRQQIRDRPVSVVKTRPTCKIRTLGSVGSRRYATLRPMPRPDVIRCYVLILTS